MCSSARHARRSSGFTCSLLEKATGKPLANDDLYLRAIIAQRKSAIPSLLSANSSPFAQIRLYKLRSSPGRLRMSVGPAASQTWVPAGSAIIALAPDPAPVASVASPTAPRTRTWIPPAVRSRSPPRGLPRPSVLQPRHRRRRSRTGTNRVVGASLGGRAFLACWRRQVKTRRRHGALTNQTPQADSAPAKLASRGRRARPLAQTRQTRTPHPDGPVAASASPIDLINNASVRNPG